MSLELVTRDDFENRTLAHYRTEGSKNGVRLYQNKDGSLTPLGRIHYGVGLGRDRSSGGAVAMLVGKKQVNKDGSLTKRGINAVEEVARDGGYLGVSKKEANSGHAAERTKVIEAFRKESYERVEKTDPEQREREKLEEEIWNKYKDQYAEATLKDLQLPVNEKNKGVVKDTFKKYDTSYESYDADKEGKLEEHVKAIQDNRDKRFKSENSITKKDVNESVQQFNDTVKALKEEREKSNGKESLAQEKKSRQQEEKDIRILSDAELDKRISRLQKEKQYSELLNERRQREKGPVEQAASKYFREFAEKLARKSLDKLADKLLQKAFGGKSNNNNGNDNKGNNSSNNKNDQNSSNGNGQKFSKAEKSQIRSMAGAGKSVVDIAQALGTTEDKIKSYMSAAGVTIS